jgi:hypothetical protein
MRIDMDDLKELTTEIRGLSTRVTHIEAVLPTLATKAEMNDLKAELIKWIVGTAIGLGVAGITVMTFVLNNAVPHPAPQPVINITVPAGSKVEP